ncbi:hypothetical protein [Mesobacillus foraminis]|uniref:hypothetical protein n=1 Tax=Mesobacillus foraminis TaxID=279826 RepID=UPI000EF47D60|nr:hypothetical protein [Mesobacillus foraminis]
MKGMKTKTPRGRSEKGLHEGDEGQNADGLKSKKVLIKAMKAKIPPGESGKGLHEGDEDQNAAG